MPEQEKPKGVYSTKIKSAVGQGMTRRQAAQKRYWFVWEAPPGGPVVVSPLNQNMLPKAQKRTITYSEFVKEFTVEPDFFVDENLRVRRLWRTQEQEEREDALEIIRETPKPPEPVKEEFRERSRELERLEQEARADFGLGVTYLKRGDKGKAMMIFESLAEMEGEFEAKHKHMFNDFGIGLRKINLLKVAVKHYRRALQLAPDDETLFHNMARIYYELGDLDKAVAYLRKSLELNPQHQESRAFLRLIRKLQQENPAPSAI